jgi:hypothetical protein
MNVETTSSRRTFTAREVLTYLYAECTRWQEDIDGDTVNGRTVVYVNHDIRIRGALLEELIDMAGIPQAGGESTLEALRRASVEDMQTPRVDAP